MRKVWEFLARTIEVHESGPIWSPVRFLKEFGYGLCNIPLAFSWALILLLVEMQLTGGSWDGRKSSPAESWTMAIGAVSYYPLRLLWLALYRRRHPRRSSSKSKV